MISLVPLTIRTADLDTALRGESLLMGFMSNLFSSDKGQKYLGRLIVPTIDKLVHLQEDQRKVIIALLPFIV
jgi:hypothetical protein